MVESCEAEVAVEALLPLVELAKSGAPAESFDSPGTRVLLTYQSPRQKRARLATVEPLTEVGSPVVTPCFQSPKSKRRPQLTPTPTREKPKEEVLSPKKGQAPPLLADFREVAILAKVPERSVLLARDAADQMVALKVLAKHSFLAPKRQRSIRVEAELMQRLDHPNIVKLLRLMEDEERLCLVIEYVPGGDMLQDILRQGRFQESHGQRLLRQLASAMSFVHSRNIVHRDLKPENILLTSSDRERTDAKITDFGISRLTMGSQDCQTYLGSRDYRAPEVVRMGMGNRKRRTEAEECAGYGKPADMWSLGVVLYVMLSGERAFDSHSKVDLEIIRGLWSFAGEIWKLISEEAKDLVKSLMQQEPRKRLTAEQVLQHQWLT